MSADEHKYEQTSLFVKRKPSYIRKKKPEHPKRPEPAKRRRSRQGNVRERIIATAGPLFRRQGYDHTGINQVIAESKTAKASFYDYFPSKDDLGRAYLEEYRKEQIAGLELICRKHGDPTRLAGAWMRLAKREIRRGNLFGCPVGNFKAQIGNSLTFDELIGSMTGDVIAVLTRYFQSAQKEGRLGDGIPPRDLARRAFVAYHGALQGWRLSGDMTFLDEMEGVCDALLAVAGVR